VDSIAKLTTGMGIFFGDGREREREAARTIASIYQLLPRYDGAVAVEGSNDKNVLFDIKVWQKSILETLNLFARQVKADTAAEKLLTGFLEGGRFLDGKIRNLSLDRILPEGRDGWLPIAGYDEPTVLRMRIDGGRSPRFYIGEPENDWANGADNTGDGTVSLRGATPPFMGDEGKARLVCLTTKNFSFWEFRDKAVSRKTFHASLPNMNLVQRLAIRFLRPEFRGQVGGDAYPGVFAPIWPSMLAKSG
jgi:hypothetical protein